MSDQADRAAEKIIAEINNCNSRECHLDKIHKTTIASLIRSTVTAPRELVEAAKELLDAFKRYEMTVDDLPTYEHIQMIARAQAALSAQEPKVCEWTRTNNHSDGTWLTGCGKEYFVRTFTRVGYSEGTTLVQPKHCPDCGSPIKVKE